MDTNGVKAAQMAGLLSWLLKKSEMGRPGIKVKKVRLKKSWKKRLRFKLRPIEQKITDLYYS